MIHVIKEGETLSAIAARYGVETSLLTAINGLPWADRLVPGQALLVLVPDAVHVVQAGDTLFSVSRRYEAGVRRLWQLNPWLMGSTLLRPGETIVLSYTDQPDTTRLVNAYAYPFINRELLRQTLPYLSSILSFTYGFTAEGGLVPLDDEELRLMAADAGTNVMMVLAPLTVEGGFSSELITALLTNPAAEAALIDNIMAEVAKRGYGGVDLDFEYVRAEDAAAYVDFARRLADRLHEEGLLLTVDLAPKYSAAQRGRLYEGHDYRALGAVADYTLLMTYEWGYTYGPPMAVAPLYEVKRVLSYGLSEIPAGKILMGIPNYGYDWLLPFQQGRAAISISNERALELAWTYGAEIRYDQAAATPYFRYTTPEGAKHEVWFEDVRSISAKLQLAEERELAGVSYWTLNRPFIANWMLLTTSWRTRFV